MLKKILIFLLLLCLQSFGGNYVFAKQIPVEKVFKDITKKYKFYDELQTLYERGMIFPDENGKFNPNKLLNRDEFVGISMEIACKRCISPNTELSLLKKNYNNNIFYDVNKKNKYFYCIAESNDLGYVKGYDKGYQCEGKTSMEGKRPFCIDNKIRLDEALAVILRNSGIFTIKDNKKVLWKIRSGEINKKLSNDVSPKNSFGEIYTFYGYLQKALKFELKEVDKNGNEKIYKLLEVKNGIINPKKAISKEDFLIIAYIALKSNSCIKDRENELALQIEVLNKDCIKGKECNNKRTDQKEKTFDINSIIGGVCEKGIETRNYRWNFYNFNSGKEINKRGKYIDNYTFLDSGKWRINLSVVDNCGKKANVYSTIFIKDNENIGLNVQIEADPIVGNYDVNVHLNGIVKGVGPYKYRWDFGDGMTGVGKRPTHLYTDIGFFGVVLIVTDKNGIIGKATTLIKVLDFNSCEIDTDGDGVMDCDDILPKIKGKIINKGAPILNKICGTNCHCQKGYECSIKDTNVCSKEGICIPKKVNLNSCLQNGYTDFVLGNSVCQSCPCEFSLDFMKPIRKCDLIFPAITSPNSKKIYGKGTIYKIK